MFLEDLATWLHALMTGGVVTAASLAQLQAPVGTESYGLGLSRRVVGGLNADDPARDGGG